MNFFDKIKSMVSSRLKLSKYKEIGAYKSVYTAFGTDIYSSETVRACIRALAEHTSKATFKCKNDPMLERTLNLRPNIYMNGKDFLYKCRTMLEINNTLFIFIDRNEFGKCIGLYPIPYSQFEAVETEQGNLYIKFYFQSRYTLVFSWKDLAVLRKDYNKYDIGGDDNTAILNSLELLNTTQEGVSNAIKSTSNLRGIIKSTKAMLKDDDVKKMRDSFVTDYLNLENEGGIAALDASMDFTPIKMEPVIANYAQLKEFRENIFRYEGVSDSFVMNDYTEDQFNATFEGRIEPFLIAMSLELTGKIYTDREIGFGKDITLESNKLQYASNTTKAAITQLMFDRGLWSVNQCLDVWGSPHVDGGDKRYIRKEYAEYSDIDNVNSNEADSIDTILVEPVDGSDQQTEE